MTCLNPEISSYSFITTYNSQTTCLSQQMETHISFPLLSKFQGLRSESSVLHFIFFTGVFPWDAEAIANVDCAGSRQKTLDHKPKSTRLRSKNRLQIVNKAFDYRTTKEFSTRTAERKKERRRLKEISLVSCIGSRICPAARRLNL